MEAGVVAELVLVLGLELAALSDVASYLGKINSPASGGIFGSRAQMVTEAMSYVWFTDPTQVGVSAEPIS